MEFSPKLSVAICTFNRADILRYCLQSLVEAPAELGVTEILVVDNNSSDNTAEVVESFANSIPMLRYIQEKTQGHSSARNRAAAEARSDWIFYLDDDALVRKETLTRVIRQCEAGSFQIFGGVYYPWYLYGRPKWFKDAYASNKMKYSRVTVLSGDETVSGGVLCASKKLLDEFGGFNPNVGMIGKRVGYWDETELQMRIRAKGYSIAYDPSIEIEHLVPEYKLVPDWYFRASFIKGRDQVLGDKVSTGIAYLLFTLIVCLLMPALLMLKNLGKLATREDYFIENWLIDSFRKSAKRVGIMYTLLLRKYGSSTVD
jgi:glycosyltransferase involved in cell wall biosynthesis